MLLVLASFVSGAVANGICVWWVHYAESDKALAIMVVGWLEGAAIVFGVREGVFDFKCGLAYVFGYGIGPALAVIAKKRGLK